jgi:hypothetical protein
MQCYMSEQASAYLGQLTQAVAVRCLLAAEKVRIDLFRPGPFLRLL